MGSITTRKKHGQHQKHLRENDPSGDMGDIHATCSFRLLRGFLNNFDESGFLLGVEAARPWLAGAWGPPLLLSWADCRVFLLIGWPGKGLFTGNDESG